MFFNDAATGIYAASAGRRREHPCNEAGATLNSFLMSLELFSAEEHQKLVDAERRYGNAFINAYNTTILLSNLMMWQVIDCDYLLDSIRR